MIWRLPYPSNYVILNSLFYINKKIFNWSGNQSKMTETHVSQCSLQLIHPSTKARTCKQPRCPSTNEWIKKLWCIYTMEYYSAIKRNTYEPILMRWMILEPIIQSEVSQKEKKKSYINAYTWNLEKWYWWTYLQGRNRDSAIEWTCGYNGGRSREDELRALKHIYYQM